MADFAQYPFDEYKLYIIFHKKMGRRMAVLFKNHKDRTTISYARYLMSVHLGRKLEKEEHVDHINNDKLDDRIENFQLLTVSENSRKSCALRRAKIVDITCRICGKIFSFDMRNIKFRPNPTCSRKCGRASLSLKKE